MSFGVNTWRIVASTGKYEGMTGTGTARVEVRAIDVGGGGEIADTGPANAVPSDTWLQAGAYSRRDGAKKLARALEDADLKPVSIRDGDGLYRVWRILIRFVAPVAVAIVLVQALGLV